MDQKSSKSLAVLGIDIGTSSCRAVLVDVRNGAVLGEGVTGYRSGERGLKTDRKVPGLARQEPRDYTEAMIASTRACLRPDVEVVAIGVDSTASTVLPVDRFARPLTLQEAFESNLNAQAWLWKDHTSQEEAALITQAAQRLAPEILRANGGFRYSPENIWAKVARCERIDARVWDAAAGWLEVADYVVGSVLIGIDRLEDIPRSISGATHKGLYGGPGSVGPVTAVLASFSERVAELWRDAYRSPSQLTDVAGLLHPAIAERMGLDAGIPVAVGNLDAHSAALGAGINRKTMAKVMGTSGSDLIVLNSQHHTSIPELPGACGAGYDSLVPGTLGVEYGIPAIGDAFGWAAAVFANGDLAALSAQAEQVPPGSHGIVALDWLNGNRSTLQAPGLSGIFAGITLHTTGADLFHALVESIAMSSRRIWEHAQIASGELVALNVTGGIPHRAPYVVQTLADVLDIEVRVTESEHGTATGAAITAAVAAGYYSTVEEAQKQLVRLQPKPFLPRNSINARYNEIYELWTELHDQMSASTDGRATLLARMHGASTYEL